MQPYKEPFTSSSYPMILVRRLQHQYINGMNNIFEPQEDIRTLQGLEEELLYKARTDWNESIDHKPIYKGKIE